MKFRAQLPSIDFLISARFRVGGRKWKLFFRDFSARRIEEEAKVCRFNFAAVALVCQCRLINNRSSLHTARQHRPQSEFSKQRKKGKFLLLAPFTSFSMRRMLHEAGVVGEEENLGRVDYVNCKSQRELLLELCLWSRESSAWFFFAVDARDAHSRMLICSGGQTFLGFGTLWDDLSLSWRFESFKTILISWKLKCLSKWNSHKHLLYRRTSLNFTVVIRTEQELKLKWWLKRIEFSFSFETRFHPRGGGWRVRLRVAFRHFFRYFTAPAAITSWCRMQCGISRRTTKFHWSGTGRMGKSFWRRNCRTFRAFACLPVDRLDSLHNCPKVLIRSCQRELKILRSIPRRDEAESRLYVTGEGVMSNDIIDSPAVFYLLMIIWNSRLALEELFTLRRAECNSIRL